MLCYNVRYNTCLYRLPVFIARSNVLTIRRFLLHNIIRLSCPGFLQVLRLWDLQRIQALHYPEEANPRSKFYSIIGVHVLDVHLRYCVKCISSCGDYSVVVFYGWTGYVQINSLLTFSNQRNHSKLKRMNRNIYTTCYTLFSKQCSGGSSPATATFQMHCPGTAFLAFLVSYLVIRFETML